VNKVEEGKKVLADYEQHIAQTKQQLGDLVKKTVSVVRFTAGQTRIYQLNSFSGVILKQLGFQRPENQNKNEFAIQVSREQIPDMDAEILFYLTYNKGNNQSGTQLEKEFTSDPLWKKLKAVQQQNAFKVDDIVWNTAGGVLAAHQMLDQIAQIAKQIK
jgi:iron complex transport system substrate-binding protein